MTTSAMNPVSAMDRGSMPGGIDDFTSKLLAAPRLDEPEITLEWVREQVSDAGAKGTFRTFHKGCAEADEFYLNTFDFSVPKSGSKIKLGTGHSVVNTLVSHVMPKFMDISVPPPGARGQARAERIEKFLSGAHHTMEQNTPTMRDIIKHQGLYGVAWEKVEFDPERWEDVPEPPDDDDDADYKQRVREILERRSINWPIGSSVVNPQSLVWDHSNGNNPRWIIHFYEADSSWVRATFPDAEENGVVSTGEVMVWEVWTHDQVAFYADEKPVLEPMKHGYGKRPWIMYWPQRGLVTPNAKPEDLYRGILHGLFDLLRAESKEASHYLDILTRSAWPTREFVGPPGMTGDVMQKWSDAPGAKNYRPENVQVEVSETPRPPQEIVIGQQMLAQAIESDTVSSVSKGQRPVGAASGFHTAVLAGISALSFDPEISATGRGVQEKNELVLRIVELVIRDKLTVWGKTEAGTFDESITPRAIRGHYVSIVRLNSVSPEEQERKRNQAFREWSGGFIDHMTALRNAGQSEPLEVRANLLAEAFMKDEEVFGALRTEAIRRIPIIQQILEATALTTGSTAQVDQIAQGIANGVQAPNAGNFSADNQPGFSFAGERQRTATNTSGQGGAGVMPGSLQEANQIGRQIAGPRSGNRRVPGADLGPGGGIAR
jgi:hypothetical protein